MKLHTLSFLLAFAVSTPSQAQSVSARALVEQGASAYVKEGASAAVAIWLKGSALEGNTQATSQANGLRQVEDFYGKPTGFDILKEVTLSPRSKLVFYAINFQKGLLYARMQAYELPTSGWVTTEFKFHTEAVNILPPSMVVGLQ